MPVYMVKSADNAVKIGHAKDPAHRVASLQTGHHQRLTIIRLFEGGRAEEKLLHGRFAELKIGGEWFSFSKAMMGDVGLVEIPPSLESALPEPVEILLNTEQEYFNAIIAELAEQWRRRQALIRSGMPDALKKPRVTFMNVSDKSTSIGIGRAKPSPRQARPSAQPAAVSPAVDP